MWSKIKEVIFHRVVGRAVAASAAAGVAYVSRPEVLTSLAAAGITIDPDKLSAAAIAGATFVLTLAYHFAEHKLSDSSTPAAGK